VARRARLAQDGVKDRRDVVAQDMLANGCGSIRHAGVPGVVSQQAGLTIVHSWSDAISGLSACLARG
jgi:hypothetical protein